MFRWTVATTTATTAAAAAAAAAAAFRRARLYRSYRGLFQRQLRRRSAYSEAATPKTDEKTIIPPSHNPFSWSDLNNTNRNGMIRKNLRLVEPARRDPSASVSSRGENTADPRLVCGALPVTAVSEAVGDSDSRRLHRSYEMDDSTGRFVAAPSIPLSLRARASQSVEASLRLILPRGYPESVGGQYRIYASWQFCGMAASAAAGVMSTQALLFAMGLGAGSIPLAATLNWVIKDGLGQLGGIAFSGLVNTRFDANPKLWRVVAAMSLDASMVLEILAPLYPAYFLPLASVANAGKNISFLAASASRAAIHNVLAAKGNLADITAKSGAQTILSCMIGTGVGVALSASLGSEWHAICPACLGLSAMHLSANYLSVRGLGMPTFNAQRLGMVVDLYQERKAFPSPEDVAARESIVLHSLLRRIGLDRSPPVRVGSRLEDAVRDKGELEELCRMCQGRPFLLAVRGDLEARTAEVHVLLLEGCTSKEVLAAGYVAQVAKRLLLERGFLKPWMSGGTMMRGSRSGPRGQILPDVIAEALNLGDTLPASPALQEALLRGVGSNRRWRKACEVAADFVVGAERVGWSTSVHFLEEAGSARLRLDHASGNGV